VHEAKSVSTGLAQWPNGLTGPCPRHCGRAPRSPRPGPAWWEPTLAGTSFGLHGGNQHVEGVAPGNRERGPATARAWAQRRRRPVGKQRMCVGVGGLDREGFVGRMLWIRSSELCLFRIKSNIFKQT
jgi:hypothetical protein